MIGTPSNPTGSMASKPGHAGGQGRCRASRRCAPSVCMFTAESRFGHARYTRDLLIALAGEGASPELVTSRDLSPEFRTGRYPIHAILPPLLDRSSYRTTPGWAVARVRHYLRRDRTFLRWLERRTGFDVVHLQEYTPWLAPLHIPRIRRAGVEVVATVHNIAEHGRSLRWYQGVSRRCWHVAWRASSALIVHTPGLRDALSAELGAGHPPIFVTPHAVWEERPGPPVPASPPPAGGRRLLFFGMIRPNKGLHVLIEAMASLPDCTLDVTGEPEDADYLAAARALAERHAPGRVRWNVGFVPESEIAGHFDACHVVVLPYVAFAAQSGVVHQAMAHGRPVVATAVGGLGECVRDRGIGEVVPPGDPAALAEGVRALLEPVPYRAAAAAALRARDELTWPKMAEATLDVYRAVLA